MFGVTPDIKIISFGVRQLKNRRVTPNGEKIKDDKRGYSFWCIDPKFGHFQAFKKNLKVQDKPGDVFSEKKRQK